MKVAVTGGRGFIGAAVGRELEARGHVFTPIDRIDGHDVREPSTWGPLLGDAVIHLAGVLGTAELFDNPYLAVDVNVVGALTVLEEAVSRGGLRYVGITMPDVFPSVYTATKVCADRLATAYHRAFGVPVSRVRAFNAYGPGQAHGPGHPQKIIPTFATLAWRGEPIPIWGDGEQTVDLVHTDDLARMLVDALDHGDDAVFDGGTGHAWTVNQVAEAVLEITGSEAGIEYLPMRAGEIATAIVAKGDGWDRLSWRPIHDHEKFIAAVESYR